MTNQSADGADVDVRHSVLGGEVAGRGLLAAAPRSRLSRQVGVAVVVVSVVVVLAAATLLSGVTVVVVLVAGWLLVWPPKGGETTRLDRWVARRRWARRHARGLDRSTRVEELRPGSSGAWELPPPLGRVEPLDLAESEWRQWFILLHSSPGGGQFLTVLMATGGLGAGLWTDEQHAATQVGFGSLLASFAKPGRWLSDLGQLSRTLPQDFSEHTTLMADSLRPPPDTAPRAVQAAWRRLLISYDQVVQREAEECEEHRNYLVARFDVTLDFQRVAARIAPGHAGWAKLVRDELVQLRNRGRSAGLGQIDILGEQRTVAALRALQNPDCPPDRHGGLSWADAFRSYTATATELLVDGGPSANRDAQGNRNGNGNDGGGDAAGGWYSRIARIPVRGLEAARLGPRWLAPVLVDMSPPVVRTVATRIRPIPASKARVSAVQDATTDTSAAMSTDAAGRIGDGTDEAMLNASTRRLRDLAPGSGHAGIEWGIFIMLQAETLAELDDACRALSEAASDAAVTELDWLPYQQDLAWPAMLGLGRGVSTS